MLLVFWRVDLLDELVDVDVVPSKNKWITPAKEEWCKLL